MAVDRRHLHPMGYVHGGAWVAFADTVAAWGTLRHLPEGRGFTTVELKINVISSAGEGDELTAIGEPLHVGSRTQVWQVRVSQGRAPRGQLHMHADRAVKTPASRTPIRRRPSEA